MKRDMRTVAHKQGILHIETPLAIYNIHVGLTDTEGHRVESVQIKPNDFAGEPKVHIVDSRLIEETPGTPPVLTFPDVHELQRNARHLLDLSEGTPERPWPVALYQWRGRVFRVDINEPTNKIKEL